MQASEYAGNLTDAQTRTGLKRVGRVKRGAEKMNGQRFVTTSEGI